MDKIHQIDKKPWICKRKIRLREVASQVQAQLLDNHIIPADRDAAYNEEKELLERLEEFAKSSEQDLKPYFLFNSTDERTLTNDPECKLKTFQLQLEHAKKMISDRPYKVNYLLTLNSTRKELLMRHLASINRQDSSVDPTTSCTSSRNPVIMPLVVVQMWPQPTKSSKMKLERELVFRADQKLTDLRDQFKCHQDYAVPMDLSDDPDEGERIYRGELFKSGYFLIEGTFFNDLRDRNSIDLSVDIINWAEKEVTIVDENGKNKKVPKGIGPFSRMPLEDCEFFDIEFRLGCPYLYVHQGDCEHLFTISDVQYVPNDDKLNQIKFPYVTATFVGSKTDSLRCYMCRNRPPHWYTRNNARLPLDPYFFCENCFFSFNYDDSRNKIGKFQAYLYTSTFGIPQSAAITSSQLI